MTGPTKGLKGVGGDALTDIDMEEEVKIAVSPDSLELSFRGSRTDPLWFRFPVRISQEHRRSRRHRR